MFSTHYVVQTAGKPQETAGKPQEAAGKPHETAGKPQWPHGLLAAWLKSRKAYSRMAYRPKAQ